jgi:thiamine kinase-like enzyme
MKMQIEDIIARIDEWRGKNIRWEPLGGGITNHNYTVYIDDEKYVMRIPGAGTDIFIDRDNELECSIEAGKSGVTPRVLHHLKPENISVVQFIQGRTLTTDEIIGNDNLIKRIVSAIKVVHEKARFTKEFDPFQTVRDYMDFVKKYDAPLPDDFDRMLATADEIESALKRNRPPAVACHNDYLSENFLDDGKQIWIIDWEYGGMGDPYFDLGDFAVEHPFSTEQEVLLIMEYCGESNRERVHDERPNRLYRMVLYKIVSDLWWSVWAMIQSRISTLDFDFYAYGNGRFDRLRKNRGNPDYKKWLECV